MRWQCFIVLLVSKVTNWDFNALLYYYNKYYVGLKKNECFVQHKLNLQIAEGGQYMVETCFKQHYNIREFVLELVNIG